MGETEGAIAPSNAIEDMMRVAITGVGVVSPLGNDAPSTWEAAVAGRSGIDNIQAFETTDLPVRIAGEVKDFDPSSVTSPKEAKRLDRNVLFALGAAKEALADAGVNGYNPERVGVVVGCCIGGFNELMRQHEILRDRGADRVSPNFLPNVLVDSPSGQLAIELGIRGPNYAVVSACATGSHSIGEGAELIRNGHADAVLAGGTESCIHPLILAGFTRHARPCRGERRPHRRVAPLRREARGLRHGGGRGRRDARGPRVGAKARRARLCGSALATAPPTTPTTWPRPIRTRSASSR